MFNDSLLACHEASAQPTRLDDRTIKERIHALDSQLRNKQLTTQDVAGDGNCLFRALSVCLYGHENEHTVLRASIAKHILSDNSSVMPRYGELSKHVNNISKNGVWVGESVIVAAADYLQREIDVYIAAASVSPLVYSPHPEATQNSPLRLAFYEPGHFRAVHDLIIHGTTQQLN